MNTFEREASSVLNRTVLFLSPELQIERENCSHFLSRFENFEVSDLMECCKHVYWSIGAVVITDAWQQDIKLSSSHVGQG